MVARGWEEEVWGITAKWLWVFLWDGENVLELDRGSGCITM